MAIDNVFLNKEDSVLLIIDIQEKLAAVMKMKDPVVANCLHLIELAKMLDIPIVVTEQYPRGLGHTVPEITGALPSARPVEKVAFNCCGAPAFLVEVKKHNRKKIIVKTYGIR